MEDKLKPLFLLCEPEFPCDVDWNSCLLLSCFSQPEFIISFSAYKRGRFRKLVGAFTVFFPDQVDEVVTKIKSFDLLVVVTLSLNSLAKFALGLRDSVPSKVFGAAVDSQVPVLLDKSVLPSRETDGINPHFRKIYNRYWEDLMTGFVGGFLPDTLEEECKKILRRKRSTNIYHSATTRQVITKDDVLAALEAKCNLKVTRGTIITDLARETASAHGIKIEFE